MERALGELDKRAGFVHDSWQTRIQERVLRPRTSRGTWRMGEGRRTMLSTMLRARFAHKETMPLDFVPLQREGAR